MLLCVCVCWRRLYSWAGWRGYSTVVSQRPLQHLWMRRWFTCTAFSSQQSNQSPRAWRGQQGASEWSPLCLFVCILSAKCVCLPTEQGSETVPPKIRLSLDRNCIITIIYNTSTFLCVCGRGVRDVWRQVLDIHNAFGLQHQWGGSHSNKMLLCSLGIDTRNIVSLRLSCWW